MKRMSKLEGELTEIIQWAGVLTGEARSWKEYYYVPEPVKSLQRSLTHLNGQLIALIGLQGTGKTSALKHLSAYLDEQKVENQVIKWVENWRDNLWEHDDFVRGDIDKVINTAVQEELESYASSHRKHRVLGRVPNREDCSENGVLALLTNPATDAKVVLGKAKARQIMNEALDSYLNRAKVIFIDLPDYTKSDPRLMTKHLSEVQALWEHLYKDKNFVIAIQKELFTGHYFFGKMQAIELTPLEPEELAGVFKHRFPECTSVTDEALILLGQLSRGVFRRFLRYLRLTCESFTISGEQPPIDKVHVKKAVSIDQIMSDMELELYNLFKDLNQRRQAVELLDHLREAGPLNQKEIAEFLNVSMMTSGKIVGRLLAHGYLKRERGRGREWIVSVRI